MELSTSSSPFTNHHPRPVPDWSAPTGTKYYLITNSNFRQNIGDLANININISYIAYNLQIAHNEYLFHNSGNIQAIKLSQHDDNELVNTTSDMTSYSSSERVRKL